MGLVASVASAFDFAEALDDTGEAANRITRAHFGLYARQASTGAAITLRTAEGQLVMIIGLYPSPEGWFEGWFGMGPALKANLREGLRAGRRIFDQVAGDSAPLEARALVPLGSVAGHRLAPLFGFHEAGQVDSTRGPLTVWRRFFAAPDSEGS